MLIPSQRTHASVVLVQFLLSGFTGIMFVLEDATGKREITQGQVWSPPQVVTLMTIFGGRPVSSF